MTAIPEQHAAHTATIQPEEPAKKTGCRCRCSASRRLDAEDWNQRYAAPGFLWTVEASRLLMGEVADLAPGRSLDLAAGDKLRIEQARRVEREVETAEGLRIALDCRVRGLRP